MCLVDLEQQQAARSSKAQPGGEGARRQPPLCTMGDCRTNQNLGRSSAVTNTHPLIHTLIYIHIYSYIHLHTFAPMYTDLLYTHVCMHTHMCAHTCTHIVDRGTWQITQLINSQCLVRTVSPRPVHPNQEPRGVGRSQRSWATTPNFLSASPWECNGTFLGL